MVGNPLMSYCPPNDSCLVMSTAPTLATPFSVFAAFWYSGTSALQWPHHGA